MTDNNSLPQPKDIPWQLMCVSKDMLDPKFCNKKFPFPWRSSIAISAYEPPESELPIPFCAGKITYLKVTVSITGYQPTDREIKEGFTEFGNTPVEVGLDEIFETYFGCYGVLLNVAVFPNSSAVWKVEDFPKIIAFEPQNRELIQAATESGELLTSSKNDTTTTNSFTNTNSVSTGINGKGSIKGKIKDLSWEAELGLTHKWGNTTEDKETVSANTSQERSEKQSTSTQIQQLYNLLSAYHLGTNRALFLMLPRPHILQPTNRRTFVQGIRSIEGVQEFFLIAARPKTMEGISVEARLDTGHFPEDLEIQEPPLNYKESFAEFTVHKHADSGFKPEQTSLTTIFTVPNGEWYIDRRTAPTPPFPKGDPGHTGITQTDIGSNSQGSPINYNYLAISDTQVKIDGYIKGAGWTGSGAIFNKKYKVWLRSINPIPSDIDTVANIADLFVTSRNLCCCFYSADTCLIEGPVPPTPPPFISDTTYTKIVEQRELEISEYLLSDPIINESLEPAVKALMRKLKGVMISSRDKRYSHFEDGINFLESDFFVHHILQYFSKEVKNKHLIEIPELDEKVKDAFGREATVEDALKVNLEKFIIKTHLECKEAIEQRKIIINQIKI